MSKVETYLNNMTWKIKENANAGYSFSGLMAYLGEEAIKEHMLEKHYNNEIAKAHKDGYMHIHDLGYGIVGYCSGWSLRELLEKGFGGLSNKIQSGPPKHLRTALGQMVNFLGTLQLEFAGAQAFSSFDTFLAPYVAKDRLKYEEVKQAMQEFVYGLNVPSRFANQAPFTNLTFDWVVPEDLKDEHPKINGEEMAETYSDFQKEMDMINKAFIEVMTVGDHKGRIFTFPIPTYNLTKDFIWDSENAKLLFTMTAKYGTPYFQNYLGSELNPSDIRSMCCRLSLDLKELKSRGNGLFGAGEQTGCYSNDTEILTENGWKLFKDLKKAEKVATMNQQTLEVEYHKPKKHFEYDYSGNLYNFYNDNMNILVTPNHRMITTKNNIIKVKEARDIKIKNSIPNAKGNTNKDIDYFVLPKHEINYITGNYNSKRKIKWDDLKIKMDDWLAFLGIYLSEGSVYHKECSAKKHGYRVTISQKKTKTRNEIRQLLHKLPWNFNEDKIGFYIYNKQLHEYLIQFGNVYNKHIPKNIFECSKRQLNILLQWLIKGDGNIHKRSKSIYYWTSSEQLKNNIQRLAIECGYHINTRKEKQKTSFFRGRKIQSTVPNYCLTMLKAKTQNITNIDSTYEYDGKVYCVEVENNIVLVKRKDKVSWCGNSLGVITLNLPKLGYETKKELKESLKKGEKYDTDKELELLCKKLKHYMLLAKDSLEIKRRLVQENTDRGLIPYTKAYLKSWKTYFSTIGIIGMNELCENLGYDGVGSKEGLELSKKVLTFMREVLSEIQEETGNMYNLEATPAEGTSFRLASIDKKQYPDCNTRGEDDNIFYTNSCHLPVGYTSSIIKATKHQEQLQTMFTGGTIFHTFLGERVTDWINCMMLVKKIANNTKLPYFSITPTFSICPIHGYISGEHKYCPLDHTDEDKKKYGIMVECEE